MRKGNFYLFGDAKTYRFEMMEADGPCYCCNSKDPCDFHEKNPTEVKP